MKNVVGKYWKSGISVLLGIGVFLFWYLAYPHALSYHEQYQLFLWTCDYFIERISVPGGLADWMGELIVQFYYVEWLGALFLALLMVALQRATARVLPEKLYMLSLLPVALMWWLMGDVNVLLSLPVALTLNMAVLGVVYRVMGVRCWVMEAVMIPLVYWLTGPMVWVYVAGRVCQTGWRAWPMPVYALSTMLSAYAWLLPQWPLQAVLTGSYYRIPMHWPQWNGYDENMYELIRLDYLVRNERWDDIVKRAGEYRVETPFWSNCVNLALAEKRLLADRMFDFWQSGEDALLMPRVRDLTSMLPSAEAFWRLGMVNSAQRYMFDTQESVLNGRKSGRCTKRLAECMLVNGHYQAAAKQLGLLKYSLFYRSWALETEALLGQESRIAAHPVYGRLRKKRYKENFLYSYEEMDKMLALLFVNNPENKMALDYMMGQMLLMGHVQDFQRYMGWVRQYGGYRMMPLGYQDVMRCIRQQGSVPDSPYGAYVKRMMTERRSR